MGQESVSGAGKPKPDFFLRETKQGNIKSSPHLGRVFTYLAKSELAKGIFTSLFGNVFKNQDALAKLAEKTTEEKVYGHIWEEASQKLSSKEVYTKLASKKVNIFLNVVRQTGIPMIERMVEEINSWEDLVTKLEYLTDASFESMQIREKVIERTLKKDPLKNWGDLKGDTLQKLVSKYEPALYDVLAESMVKEINSWEDLATKLEYLRGASTDLQTKVSEKALKKDPLKNWGVLKDDTLEKLVSRFEPALDDVLAEKIVGSIASWSDLRDKIRQYTSYVGLRTKIVEKAMYTEGSPVNKVVKEKLHGMLDVLQDSCGLSHNEFVRHIAIRLSYPRDEDELTTITKVPFNARDSLAQNEALLKAIPNFLSQLAHNEIEEMHYTHITWENLNFPARIPRLQKAILEELCTPQYANKITTEDLLMIARKLSLDDQFINSLQEKRREIDAKGLGYQKKA